MRITLGKFSGIFQDYYTHPDFLCKCRVKNHESKDSPLKNTKMLEKGQCVLTQI